MDNNIGDIGAMLARLSENPAALNLISSLIGGANGSASQSQNYTPPPPPDTQRANNSGGGLDASGLLSLLSSLTGQGGTQPHSPPSQFTANNISAPPPPKSAGIFGTKEEINNRIALLGAVRPYLSQPRRDMLENIIKLLKLTELGELGSLLGKL